MPTTDATARPPQRHAFYISYQPEDFPDERAAAEHFALHWAERLEEDLGIILGDDELAAAAPEEVLLGGGAVFMFDQWRLVARMEVFDFASMSPGDESPVGRQKLVRCPEVWTHGFRRRLPPRPGQRPLPALAPQRQRGRQGVGGLSSPREHFRPPARHRHVHLPHESRRPRAHGGLHVRPVEQHRL